MTKILFPAPLLDLYGQKITDENGKETTLASCCVNALTLNFADETNLGGDVKLKRFLLAEKIADATVAIELTADETVMLKGVVAKAYGSLVVGRVYRAVDPASMK
ncbi:MAG: hypothetical protein EOS03_12580 [Mesorhizobium sp.]|uniref:hypothetical protein n=1 Tax=Mesorhizobium sp. TaxID=1871066 RepID=UPI000FE46884|nr:hypothetical protein [Mesorhizobium sp.]RWN47187.1 MAG: hypothetical protein EOS03_12580 [Mesorhizobium sp.]